MFYIPSNQFILSDLIAELMVYDFFGSHLIVYAYIPCELLCEFLSR
jgi:hypothetical protein